MKINKVQITMIAMIILLVGLIIYGLSTSQEVTEEENTINNTNTNLTPIYAPNGTLVGYEDNNKLICVGVDTIKNKTCELN